MKMKLLAAALLLGSSSFAIAADAVIYEPSLVEQMPTSFNWSGAYIGAQVGYAWGDSHYSNRDDERINYDPDGFFGGFYGGYNHQFTNNVVLGVDGDINFSGIDGDGDFYWGDGSGLDPNHVANSKVKYNGALRARLGYAMDRWMPYVAGGLSVAKYEFDLREPGDHHDFSESKTLTGWNIGGGVEYAATDNILVRAEYRYSDFGSKSFDHGNGFADGAKIDLNTHDIRLGIAYKF